MLEREVGAAPGILDGDPFHAAFVLDPEVARVAGDGAIGGRDLDLRERIVAVRLTRGRSRVGVALAVRGDGPFAGSAAAGDQGGERERCDHRARREASGHRHYHVTQFASPNGTPP